MARFQSILQSLCPWPPARKVPVDNPRQLHQRGNGVRAGEGLSSASLVTAKHHQNPKIKLNAPAVYIQIVVHLDCDGD